VLSKKANIAFNTIAIMALLLAPAQSFVMARTINTARDIARCHPLKIVEHLDGWQRHRQDSDIGQSDVILRSYNNGGTNLAVVARQSSIYDFVHDLYFCLSSNEETVNILGKRAYPTGTTTLNCKLIQDEEHGNKYLTLMWFQNQSLTAPDLDSFRIAVLNDPSVIKLPLCRNVRVSIDRSNNFSADEVRLVAAACQVYHSQF